MGKVKYPKLQDTEWLRQEYSVKKRRVDAIARDIGCHEATVSAMLRRRGLVTSRRGVGRVENVGPVDLAPVYSHEIGAPAGKCCCERALLDEDGLCCKCGK